MTEFMRALILKYDLTAKQAEAAQLTVEGYNTRQASLRLNLSHKSAKERLRLAYQKLGYKTKNEQLKDLYSSDKWKSI